MGKFVLKETKTGSKFVFNLKAGNGQVIGTSETYASKSSALGGIESVRKNAAKAETEDQSKADYTTVKNPKFEVYVDKRGEFRFRLKAGNGEPILGSEGYATYSACLNGVESVRKNAAEADVSEE